MSIITLSAPVHSAFRRRVDKRYWLLFVAFILGGVFEVIDNILGIRQLNFESSAPAFIKVLKEAAILWLIFSIARRNGLPRLTFFGLLVVTTLVLCVLSVLMFPPSSYYAQIGFAYYLMSLSLLLFSCALISPSDSQDFANYFVLPVILAVLLTQCLEIGLAPISLYHETSLFELDRRAGIAVIPTTAGLLGVVGFATLRGVPRLLSLAVIALASSSVSIICLAIVFLYRIRRPVYALIAMPLIVVVASMALTSRAGLETSITTRLDILSDSIQQFAMFGPSQIGALATAKSVAINPIDSYIVDSMYLETLHIFGIIPGTILLITIFATLYRRAGSLAVTIFALAGIGYLILEAWIVWIAIIFAFNRSGRVVPTRSSRGQSWS